MNLVADINLIDLPPEVFPLEIPIGTTLTGNFSLNSVNHGQSRVTRIFFPHLYEFGIENTVSDFNDVSPLCNNDYASAFKMLSRSQFLNICLYGPRTDTKDWSYGAAPGAFVDLCTVTQMPRYEGINSGIQVYGNECLIANCEIYGFGHFGVQVRDMVFMNGNGFDHGHCYDEASNVAKGYFEFKQNYVHNCKANGLGYGLWVSSGSSYKVTGANSCNVPPSNSFNANAPDEVAYIHDNVFLKTNMTLRQQPAV